MIDIMWFDQLNLTHIPIVGGKNASLGEMISNLQQYGIAVPAGFATTTIAYQQFIKENKLDIKITSVLAGLNVDNVIHLAKASKTIQEWIYQAAFSAEFSTNIAAAYQRLVLQCGSEVSVAVRSSATTEDLAGASFAGQQDSYLNIRGEEQLKQAIKHVFASLYNDRAIAYRAHHGFSNSEIAISVGVQQMVRSDLASSGVMFSLDTESGFDKVVFITASYGLGECIVQGMVTPDEFYIYKPNLASNKLAIIKKSIGSKNMKMLFTNDTAVGKSVHTVGVSAALRMQFSITDAIAIELARAAVIIERHYGTHMDIEWGVDGLSGKVYILQARPETVHSQQRTSQQLRYYVKTAADANILLSGRAIGQKAATGRVKLLKSHADMALIAAGDILVTDMTDPDWEPIMKKAAGIVTNRGGRTCHAAIIARELGIPAIVGCVNATSVLRHNQEITLSCCNGDTGIVYDGIWQIETIILDAQNMPTLPVDIMLNVGNPELAFRFAGIPNCGVGLARLEFIINRQIGIHPQALLNFATLPDMLQHAIKEKIAGYISPVEFYTSKLTEGIATIAAAFYPKKVIVRLSDFKSNEYSNLIGGKLYEPIEENPMIGFRGASRYIAASFRECFNLECQAIKRARNEMGFENIAIMVPFVRTTNEAATVIELLKANGLERGELLIYMMCEIPSNAILAEQFLAYFDGFSIGSNDMTQLILGIDRDTGGDLAKSFDERNEAVKQTLHLAIAACRKHNKYIGICGQGPSDHPDFASWLITEGIDTISLNPDTVINTWLYLHKHLNLAH